MSATIVGRVESIRAKQDERAREASDRRATDRAVKACGGDVRVTIRGLRDLRIVPSPSGWKVERR